MSTGTEALSALLDAVEDELERVTTFELKQTLSVLRRALLKAKSEVSDRDYEDYMGDDL